MHGRMKLECMQAQLNALKIRAKRRTVSLQDSENIEERMVMAPFCEQREAKHPVRVLVPKRKNNK